MHTRVRAFTLNLSASPLEMGKLIYLQRSLMTGSLKPRNFTWRDHDSNPFNDSVFMISEGGLDKEKVQDDS